MSKKLEVGDVLYYQFQNGRKSSTIFEDKIVSVGRKYYTTEGKSKVHIDTLLDESDYTSTQHYASIQDIIDQDYLYQLRKQCYTIPQNLTANQYERIIAIIEEKPEL